ncbi:MAG: UDP-N-acetylglucosamine--N-acetylmuramyl-(pentapeptide) pyrophosphoryl-undecaprenol N-acetylglucosamine transferase [marine bacterium B5-7]|nr:MAG: UDP-N-acetylglucosamine--N-acetylmuramyl-(pentapeptide) pyrophosphoryl-undecaprenol N-acetylglucosamine transferase [marine bacterium B5-7]
MKTLMVMAGGTGGHVYPALAVAEYMRNRGVRVVWLGTRAGLEARVIPEAGFDIFWMTIAGLRGKGLTRYLAMPFMLLRAIAQGIGIVRRERPDALLGMGGFAAGPGAVSGWLLRRPLVIHEANARAGLTNRLLAPLARRVLCGFPETEGLGKNAEWTGNPIRQQFTSSRQVNDARANEAAFNLLIIGGSLGARVFNRELPACLQNLAVDGLINIRHQCGRGNLAEVRDAYDHRGIDAEVEEFIDDMGEAYAKADLVICRAGAMTVAEVCMAGVAAIFVPYPHAAGDHQRANARYLADQGGALLLDESDFNQGKLNPLITSLISNRAQLDEMASKAHELARSDATETVASACLEVMHA